MSANIDKIAVARAFGRAAAEYNRHAQLQRRAGDRLMSLVDPASQGTMLDAGCGTGWFSQQWRQYGYQVIALDLSAEMLLQASNQQAADCYLTGDIEDLPLADCSVDLTWSNLAVQWCGDLRRGVEEMCRVTKPGGKVLFSTLTAHSLHEVHRAWRAVDRASHANHFLSIDQIATACSGLNVTFHQQTLTLTFASVLDAMRSLKGIGATHLSQGRQHTLLTRTRLQQLESAWPCNAKGYLLTYHLLYGVIDCD